MTKRSFIALLLCSFTANVFARSPRRRLTAGLVEEIDLEREQLIFRHEDSNQMVVFKITTSIKRELEKFPRPLPAKAMIRYSVPALGKTIIHKISFDKERVSLLT
jgi:hypothetical protein